MAMALLPRPLQNIVRWHTTVEGKGMNYKKLKEAAAALERAADAVMKATTHPHTTVLPCKHQITAAKAEVACAKALIKDAEGDA